MNLDFNNMDDEQFRKEFIRFLHLYRSNIENLMNNNNKRKGLFLYNPFGFDEDMVRKIINNINENIIPPEKNEWEEDFLYKPFNRDDYKEPGNKIKFNKDPKGLNTIELLNKKLYQAVSKEDYENAAKIRDLIKSLSEDKKIN